MADIVELFHINMPFVLSLLATLVLFNIVNWILGGRFNILGIYPRSIHGLIGIPFAPVLHGNPAHLFFNLIPLFIFINFVLIGGVNEFYCVSTVIIVLSGLAIWLMGRKAIHIGASSLIMGYWSYLLVDAYYHPTVATLFVGITTLYYFAGLFMSIIPSDEPGISWEGHLFGAAAGLAANYLCPYLAPYFV